MQTHEDLIKTGYSEENILEQPEKSRNYTLRELAAGDVRAWMKLWSKNVTSDSPVSFVEGAKLAWRYAGLRATLLFRVAYILAKKRVPVLPGVLTSLNITLHGFDVPATVKVGPGLYVPHPVGTVIMAEEIGSNVSLISSITIGMRNELKFPRIGNNVFVGTGARILGDITIGDNASIGANAVVLADVPPGATAVGIPAKVKLPQAE